MEHTAQEVPLGHFAIVSYLALRECTGSFPVCYVSQPDESEVFDIIGPGDSLPLDDNFGGSCMDIVLPDAADAGTDAGRHRQNRISGGRYWTPAEHQLFLQGLEQYGRGKWTQISELIPTRSSSQVRSHAQKHYGHTATAAIVQGTGTKRARPAEDRPTECPRWVIGWFSILL